ncbi:hypothetical protein [Microvirga rosea]|uniref:hypothetical protein n=1 Tax=Microvirga rosea TaxID=2715425 RepID=UPI001D0B7F07|nr:hypothetical protein [Microvirga rosea]MCB8820202.1 hypothetical protein [Microvirga rosea]
MDQSLPRSVTRLREGNAEVRRSQWQDFAIIILLIGLSIAFKLAFEASLPYFVNPKIMESLSLTLRENPLRALWPGELEPGRFHWVPTSLLPFYALSQFLSAFQIYLVLSSLAGFTAFTLSRLSGRSRVFAVTLALLLMFGTQLSYGSTLGLTHLHYLVVTYTLLNLYAIGACVRRGPSPTTLSLFGASLILLALSTEIWINYAIGLLLSCAFLSFWARHGADIAVASASRTVAATVSILLGLYLAIRMTVARQYMLPGAEEELIFTYKSYVLMAEDFITNFFTFLYMALSNFLPSFLASSNSLTYLGPDQILAGQNGYHPEFQHLAVMNHLFFWRFLAGIWVAGFVFAFYYAVRNAFEKRSGFYAAMVCCMLIVATGCCTYLLIKFRPYNSTPALHYKAIISILGVALLVSVLLEGVRSKVSSGRVYLALAGAVWAILLIGDITRPGMIKAQLQSTGLTGYGDPLDMIRKKLGSQMPPVN